MADIGNNPYIKRNNDHNNEMRRYTYLHIPILCDKCKCNPGLYYIMEEGKQICICEKCIKERQQ